MADSARTPAQAAIGGQAFMKGDQRSIREQKLIAKTIKQLLAPRCPYWVGVRGTVVQCEFKLGHEAPEHLGHHKDKDGTVTPQIWTHRRVYTSNGRAVHTIIKPTEEKK